MSDRRATNQPNAEVPVATVRRSRSGRGLVIAKCPNCGRRHLHGDGGQRGRGWHGHRVGHCRNPRDAGLGYHLVECAVPESFPCAPVYRGKPAA